MSDCGKSEEDNFTLSTDSTSTFEFIEEGRLSNSRGAWLSTKEEKQKHNEEIVMESVGSWEKIEIADLQKDEIETCREFLVNEKSFNEEEIRPNVSTSKPCFIDASSLLDDDYMPISFAAALRENSPKSSTAGYSGPSSFSQPEKNNYDIKDQYSAIPSQFNIPKHFQHQQHSSLNDMTSTASSSTNHWSNNINNNDYASDVSSNYVASEEYSSESCGASGNFNMITKNNNFSHYESLASAETPYNSIVHLSKKLEICEIDGSDYEEDYNARITSSPIPIKRISKCDESAPILSGGASIIDFTPQIKCDSPSVRRKTDSCPIVSGGSLDIAEEEPAIKTKKAVTEREKNSFSWIVDLKDDFKNELKIVEEIKAEEQKPATPKNSLGFYVDFGSLEAAPSEEKIVKKSVTRKSDEVNLRRGTGFYVDFSDSSCPNTPKQTPRVSMEPKKFENITAAAVTANINEKKSFFIDLNDTKEDELPPVETSEELKNDDELASSTNSKKGCFMFIETDPSPLVVRHRAKIANASTKDPTKRHSWNVNQLPEHEAEIKANSRKAYQRSSSVNVTDQELHEKSIVTVPSKTSSLSIASSISPHEDFSCSKSLSSRSNFSTSTSNTSIDQSETKVQEKIAARKRRKEAKINETYDKSSQGSVTDEIFSNQESPTSSTDTDDVTFQNQIDENEKTPDALISKEATLIEDLKIKMDTIVERSEHSSPFKKANPPVQEVLPTESTSSQTSLPCHTMESLQQLIEKQKQLLENADSTSTSFVKLSDLDKPAPTATNDNSKNTSNRKDYPFMTNSAGFRVSLLDNQGGNQKGHQNMSRSTGNNFVNLASSVENSKSLSRLFPHLSKGEKEMERKMFIK